jgi:hypothetical protein
MSDVSWGRKVFALVAVASAIRLGLALAIADSRAGHQFPFVPGKYWPIVWGVVEIFWHPMIGIPVLAVLVIGVVVYVWAKHRPRYAPPPAEEFI